MVLPDGAEVEIRAGDAFVIPKGFEYRPRFQSEMRHPALIAVRA